MKLVDLEPRWWFVEEGRSKQGVSFNCPCCKTERLAVAFANPLDGGPPDQTTGTKTWQRTGDTFETLSLTPSVDASAIGHWHGFIHNGELT